MSRQHINAYRTRLANLRDRSGSANEGVVSDAFRFLLERWGGSADLMLVPQWEATGPRGNAIRIDGALVPKSIRFPLGFWEAKDQKDDLAREIAKKIRDGYPTDNIIFEDTREAVLYQNRVEVWRAPLTGDDDAPLVALLTRFFAYDRPEIAEFKAAAKQFHADLPVTLGVLREALAEAEAKNATYRDAAAAFLDHAKAAINPAVTADDVREMLIQHILTEAIFARVFDDAAYHTENNVAQRLMALEKAFFTGDLRHRTTERLKPYYNAITRAATGIPGRAEKQAFLKTIYEGFYKVYNPKAADRLGVVYTPGEIVRFMIRGADWLCEKHFGKCLIDPGVEILDPATGTGTFIVELLEHFAGDREKLRHKYKEELHANEVAILPYYVANLNIEATYAALTGQYAEFPNLCFVDTLDNTAGLGVFAGHQGDMFGSFSDENIGRIKRQNERKISVIIGNPPYNANQQNENDNNKNRTYARIDARIKDTYIKASTAQKTKLYDMYARFFRWASDRLKDEGIVAFITNRSFIDAKTFDGFRKTVFQGFSELYIIDLGGDYKNPGAAGKANVFGISTGVAIAFLIKRDAGVLAKSVGIASLPDSDAREKLAWLDSVDLPAIDFRQIKPSMAGQWINQSTTDWTSLAAVADLKTKSSAIKSQEKSIFKLISLGVITARDDWVYARSDEELLAKVDKITQEYSTAIADPRPWAVTDADEPRFRSPTIKWTRRLKKLGRRRQKIDPPQVRNCMYRPFARRWLALSKQLNEELYSNESVWPASGLPNRAIWINDTGARSNFMSLATDAVADYHFGASVDGYQQLPRYRYLPSGERVDNVTDWAVAQFAARYPDAAVTKDAIFAYVYAALHDPVYRTTYAADLRREFPRIPLHDDFARWVAWGQALLDLHIGYETVAPFALTRVDTPTGKPPVPKLKSLPDTGVIVLDSDTQLTGMPATAWDYRLGNRSAIDWVLDQHKEKKIKDPTVARLFDTYRFADHKERVIDLLGRVIAVSLATVAITEAMAALPRLEESAALRSVAR